MPTFVVHIQRVSEYVVDIECDTLEEAATIADQQFSKKLDRLEPTYSYPIPKEEWPIEVI